MTGKLLPRAAAAATAGPSIYLSFEPNGLWWSAVVGLALLFGALNGVSWKAGFGYGSLAGLSLMLPLLWWTGEFVGPIGSIPLAAVEAVLVGVPAAAIAAVSRAPAAPLWAAMLWVAGELLRATVPFGGFPWAKIAFGQVDGAFLPLVAVGGTPLVAFAVALTGFCLARLVLDLHRSGRWRAGLAAVAAGFVVPAALAVAAAGLVDVTAENGRVTVAVVQGDVPRPGLDFNAERRAVLDNHVSQTVRLARAVEAGRSERPDLVVWPENSSDIDPYTNRDAFRRIQRAASSIGVPILVGAVVAGDGGPRNTMLLWRPGLGPTDEYDKRRLQPFGETMPFRSFFRLFSDDVDRAGRFVPGSDATIFDAGGARVAMAMCYEVIFDDTVRASVTQGADLIAVPSNNATFGYSKMTFQQLAIDRVRSVEHGRSVVVPTTSGVSAVIAPDGEVLASTGMFEPAVLVESVPLRSTLTVADRLGAVPEYAMTITGLVALLLWSRRPLRKATTTGTGLSAPRTGPSTAHKPAQSNDPGKREHEIPAHLS